MNKVAFYAILLSAIIAGTSGVFIKHLPSMTVGSIAWFRTVIPVIVILPNLLKERNSLFKGNYKKMLLASAINALRMYLYLVAFIYTSIGNAVVLIYSWPILVSIISALVYKEKIKKGQVFILTTAFLGMLLVCSNKSFSFESRDFIGMIAAICTAISYAVTVVIFKSESKNFNSNQMIFYQNSMSALVFIPFLISLSDAKLEEMGIATVYGFVIGVIVYKLFFFGLKHLSASVASSIMYLEVVSAIILGYFIFDERIEWNTILGGGLILISSYFISKMSKKQEAETLKKA